MTIKEISDKISISTATIDRVIHNRGRVNPQTKAYILEKLDEYNYVPNPNGQVMAGIKKRFKVATILPDIQSDSQEEFIDMMYKGLSYNFSILRNSGARIYDVRYKKGDQNDLINKFSELMEEKVNSIIMYAPEFYKAESMLKQARKEGCFIVSLNCKLSERTQDAYCGHDNYISGKTAMQMLCMKLRPNSNIAIFAGSSEESSHVERLQGALDYLESIETHYNVISKIDGSDDIEEKVANQWKNKKIDGILILSIYPVIMETVRKRKEAENAVIGCFDLTRKNIEALKNHDVSFIIEQNPFHQSKKAIDYVHRHLYYGVSKFDDYCSDCTIITDINIDVYLRNHDYLTSDEYDL